MSPHTNRETVTLRQRELQRVEVISRCVDGHLACARAAALLDFIASADPTSETPLPARQRRGSGTRQPRPSQPPPLAPAHTHQTILRLARTRYAGFNDHHLCEKLSEQEGVSLSRETLRRLLRTAGVGSPRKRRPPAHRQRRLRSAREGELVQLDGSPHDWLEGRGPCSPLWACRMMLPAKSSPARSSPRKLPQAISACCKPLAPLSDSSAFYGDRGGVLCATTSTGRSTNERLATAGSARPTRFGRALQQLSVTFIAAQSPQAKGRVERLWGVLQIVSPANCTGGLL